MNSNARLFFLLAAVLVAASAHAQYAATPIKHVIVIFQENRTPDNLFQGLCSANGGVPGCSTTAKPSTYDIASTYVNSDGQTVPLTPVGLATNFDLDHSHGGPKLDNTISGFNFEFAHQGVGVDRGTVVPALCGANTFGCVVPADNYSQFMYVYNSSVTNSDGSKGDLLDPYITLATTYGWGTACTRQIRGRVIPRTSSFLVRPLRQRRETTQPASSSRKTPGHSTGAAQEIRCS
jgi:hypothetical protein